MCYRVTDSAVMVEQLKAHMHRMHVLPRVKWPTASGLAHRIAKIRKMMGEVTTTGGEQLKKWGLK
jgi:hypothetical protein